MRATTLYIYKIFKTNNFIQKDTKGIKEGFQKCLNKCSNHSEVRNALCDFREVIVLVEVVSVNDGLS